ncbi:4-hydroxy 2-oxovalerate aldolase [Marinospirillum celere]|uniref:4-hydroxy 2-oxovalerate aldolase n=1 Tax=Marinospirillum celere TaxID=1122252 RepID=A0A1I1GR18_9GAMM|nr:aldolase catalytic domain-containing protein [Marinospirillum celere]SFC13915.1 4-hydroxy 2-oxovalerate aldolase [Marinospirillum celere]
MHPNNSITHLDCTLRDGGYYNAWDFSAELINDYLEAMHSAGIQVVELGFRSLENQGFKGACAYTRDDFIAQLNVPSDLALAVMINGKELATDDPAEQTQRLKALFPNAAAESPVQWVRFACHLHEFKQVLPATHWLKKQGYKVGFNLMQIADRSEEEITELAHLAAQYPLDVLYFADSMGSMTPEDTARIVGWLRKGWSGELGIHTHNNQGLALQNSLKALDAGVTWLDSTVTGMGRGPGNAKTEELAIELAKRTATKPQLTRLLSVIRRHFQPLQNKYGWGTNPYYYLAGLYGIHPTYIQEMLGDSRYDEEDILAVIEHLRVEGGKKFNLSALDAARHFYQGTPRGQWQPSNLFKGRSVLILGTGPGVAAHQQALESFIQRTRPLVVALNTQSALQNDLIDLRVACHPVRLLADCETHTRLPQPLATPISMLPEDVQASLQDKQIYDFGLAIQPNQFEFSENYCTCPSSLVIAYALGLATSGQSKNLLMAGFDGYGADDPRSKEMQHILDLYQQHPKSLPLTAVTPTRYALNTQSIYAL